MSKSNIKIRAFHATGDKTEPIFAEMSAVFDSDAERDEFLARFPKSVGVKATRVYGYGDEAKAGAKFRVDFRSDGVNGGVNETGIKRFRRFVALAPEAEIYRSVFTELPNRYDSIDEILNALRGS